VAKSNVNMGKPETWRDAKLQGVVEIQPPLAAFEIAALAAAGTAAVFAVVVAVAVDAAAGTAVAAFPVFSAPLPPLSPSSSSLLPPPASGSTREKPWC